MNRKILYGYQIQDGKLIAHPQETVVVHRIFASYLGGITQKQIADMLNGEKIPYSVEKAAWNQQNISKIMGNPRYIGQDGYPALLDKEIFSIVQERMCVKNMLLRKADRPAKRLKNRCRCRMCGNILHWQSSSRWKDVMHFKCEHCRIQISIPDNEFLAEIARQADAYAEHCSREILSAPYEPSGEVICLTNAINRSLENPEQLENVITLILQGVSARYDSFPAETLRADFHHAVKKKNFKKVISYISISADNTIAVTFKL